MAHSRKQFCVYTVPAGQAPARLMKCLRECRECKRQQKRERIAREKASVL